MDVSKYSENARLFYVRKMDWGLIGHRRGEERHEDTWMVYANGHLVANRNIAHYLNYSDRKYNFSNEEFKDFCAFLDEFPKTEDNLDGCDGTGYEMCLYDEKGRVIHKFVGYIYGNPCLTKLMKYLEMF